MTEAEDLDAESEAVAAGEYGAWLRAMQRALRHEADADVPCGSCAACCTSSQFIHIGPDEHDALAHIPSDLLFPAPMLPRGHVVMGYTNRGHCPMLIDNRCSIYAYRPRTCRTYDCRVFPGSGVTVEDSAKAGIRRRTRAWEFDYADARSQAEHVAVRRAAAYLSRHPEMVPSPGNALTDSQCAVLAIEIYEAFLDGDSAEPAAGAECEPDAVNVRAAIAQALERGAS